MSPIDQGVVDAVRKIVIEHYESDSSPFLLSDLGANLRNQGLWPAKSGDKKSVGLREFIESLHDPDLCIIRDRNSPAYVAVATQATKPVVEKYIERRSQTVTTVPDLESLPRSVLLAFCVQVQAGEHVFLDKLPPFRYEIGSSQQPKAEQVEIDDRYRRSGLKITNLSDLSAADRLDLQTKIATWSRDKNVPVEYFYRSSPLKRHTNALERLLAAQPPGLAAKIVIPADIALLLSRQE
jgi:hypothetical protein